MSSMVTIITSIVHNITCLTDLLSEKMMTGLIKSVTMLLSSKCKQVVKACLDFIKVSFSKPISLHSTVCNSGGYWSIGTKGADHIHG